MLLGAFLATGQRAWAAEGEIPPRHAEVKFIAPTDDVQGLEKVLGELLARLEVSVRFTRVATVDTRQILTEHPNEPAAVARTWIDLRDASRVTVFLSGAHQDRLLIRQVPLVSRIDEVAREEIAHIVEATVDALLVGGSIGVVTDEGTGPKPSFVPTAQRLPAGPRLDLGVGYEAEGWSTDYLPLHGPAMYLGFTVGSGRVRGGLFLSAQFRISETVTTGLAGAGSPSSTISTRLDQGCARGLGVVDVMFGSRWALRGGLGAGVDWVHVSTQTEAPNIRLAGERTTTVPMLRGLLAVRYAFTPRSEVFFGLGADFDLIDTRYFVRGPSGVDDVVFQPWRLRPLALIGVGSDILAR